MKFFRSLNLQKLVAFLLAQILFHEPIQLFAADSSAQSHPCTQRLLVPTEQQPLTFLGRVRLADILLDLRLSRRRQLLDQFVQFGGVALGGK